MRIHDNSIEKAFWSRSNWSGRLAASLLFASILLWGNATASAEQACALSQLTATAGAFGSGQTSISADGNRVAFPSDRDLTGENPDGNVELFLYDATAGAFLQITHSTEGSNELPSLSADGTRVAFQSTSDLTGENPDGNYEIFLFDASSGTFRQVTVSTDGSSGSPSISADGTRIAFVSNCDLTGENWAGNSEVFLFGAGTGALIQVTRGDPGDDSRGPSISADGTRVALSSNGDFTGGNPDRNDEIFLYDLTTFAAIQVTDTAEMPNFFPSVSGDGTRIVFSSTANLTGGNSDANFEIYLFDAAAGTFVQITDTTGDTAPVATISADGRHVAIQSESDLTGGNPDGNVEVFLYDTATAAFKQLTNSAGDEGTGGSSVNGDGTRVSFASTRDLAGLNADGNSEIFLSDCQADSMPAVHFDVRPGSCPNSLKVNERGMLAAAILGTAELDVREIEPGSLLLEGVPPTRTDVRDVAALGGREGSCTTAGPDGFADLVLKFSAPEVLAGLGPLKKDESRMLILRGKLVDGRAFEARDSVVFRARAR